MRGKYLRAAFVGDVRLPFLVFIVLLAIFFSGWLVAQSYYTNWMVEREQRIRAELWGDAHDRFFIELSRVRDTAEENAAHHELMNQMVEALERARKQGPDGEVDNHQ